MKHHQSVGTGPSTRGRPRTMAAVVQDGYGSAPEDVLRFTEIPVPAVGGGDGLVRVSAASVDRGTWHLMAGLAPSPPPALRLRRPAGPPAAAPPVAPRRV